MVTHAFRNRYELLCMPYSEDVDLNAYPTTKPIWTALLLVTAASDEFYSSPSSPIIRSLVRRLKSYLETGSGLPSFWQQLPFSDAGPTILLWIVTIGALHTAGHEERAWFIQQIQRGVQLRGLKSVEDLRSLCLECAYVDRLYVEELRRVWTEMLMLQRTQPTAAPVSHEDGLDPALAEYYTHLEASLSSYHEHVGWAG